MKDITDKEFKQLAAYMKDNYGINLFEKKTLLVGRLNNILIKNQIKDFTEYYSLLISDTTGTMVTELINKLSTNHTFFLREESHFHFFRDHVLPYLSSIKSRNKDFRIWSAGCSTGEEPYTLAMILSDFFGPQKNQWDTKILATDISKKVLDIATKGIYSREQLSPVSDSWKKRYFKKLADESYAVADSIKDEVIFRIFNLMNRNMPFKKKFDVIFCRNVMIYFDAETKNELVNRFYEQTEPGGYLFIGHSESINREETKYRYIMPAVYRKE
ncbi:MAG: CheR family methyltransferase [Bacillota bacterium]